MISASDIKAMTTISQATTADDVLIGDLIMGAIVYISNDTPLSLATSGDSFEEMVTVYNSEFWLSSMMSDPVVTSIKGYDADDTEYILSGSDYKKRNDRLFVLNFPSVDLVRIDICYTSQFGIKQYQSIIKEIALYEYLRTPKKTGMMNKTNEAAGQVTVSYKTPTDFYKEIDIRVGNLILRGV